MMEQTVLQDLAADSRLLFSKLVFAALIHSMLVAALLLLGRHYKRPVWLLSRLAGPRFAGCIGVAIVIGMATIPAGFVLATSAKPLTTPLTSLLVLHAGLLSLWYLELAILLGRRFFPVLLGDQLPAEIVLFISFVLMTNAGYFTLMLLVALFRSRGF